MRFNVKWEDYYSDITPERIDIRLPCGNILCCIRPYNGDYVVVTYCDSTFIRRDVRKTRAGAKAAGERAVEKILADTLKKLEEMKID